MKWLVGKPPNKSGYYEQGDWTLRTRPRRIAVVTSFGPRHAEDRNMLEITGNGTSHTCDGVSRRDFLQVGSLGAVGY